MMKIYCHDYISMAEALQRYTGKDVWLLVVILYDIPDPYNTKYGIWEPLPQGKYYIKILSVDGDTCKAYLWDKDYFDAGSEWYMTLARAQEKVYTILTDKIIFDWSYPEVMTTADLEEEFQENINKAADSE